jgi:hypothetical protein
MIPALRPSLLALGHFLRTPSLSRSVVALLTGAIALLLIVNIGVFVMLQRTSASITASSRANASASPPLR